MSIEEISSQSKTQIPQLLTTFVNATENDSVILPEEASLVIMRCQYFENQMWFFKPKNDNVQLVHVFNPTESLTACVVYWIHWF